MKRLLSLLLVLAMVAALPVISVAEESESIYPLDTDVTLRYWSTCNKPYTRYTSYKESPFHVKLSENTGVNIEWEFPTSGVDDATAYNLMMTDYENYPDIIFYSFSNPQELIDDGILVNLDDYIEYAPNLKKYLEENPLVDKAVRTDEGALYMFPWVRGDAWLATFRGMAVRGDWLEELGLAVPETLDELDAVAHAFKEHYGAYFSTNNDWLYDSGISTAFNTWEEFYVDDDQKVQYGPANEGWREYLVFMKYWYDEGLIDPDFASVDSTILKTKVLNNEVGVSYTTGGTVNTWVKELEALGSPAVWTPILNPVKNKGDITPFSQVDPLTTGGGAAVTTTCKDIETAIRFLDYAYSEEGAMYYNFGTLGETYTIDENGVLSYTDLIMKDPDGVNNAIDKYCGTQWATASIQDKRMYVQKNAPIVVECIDTWNTNTTASQHKFSGVSATVEEANELAPMETALKDYMQEMKLKAILGQIDFADDAVWANYLKQLDRLGLDRILEIKQAQLDRKNAR
ncbi:MAG: extracellular solute-binding protein [Aristaeellaceae bacterium]